MELHREGVPPPPVEKNNNSKTQPLKNSTTQKLEEALDACRSILHKKPDRTYGIKEQNKT